MNHLRDELKSVGAAPDEAIQLEKLSGKLTYLKQMTPAQPPIKSKRRRILIAPSLLALAVGAVVGAWVISVSQSVLPGSIFYPVKIASEKMAMVVTPDYKSTAMMHRAWEVRQLVAQKKSDTLVVEALIGYKSDMQNLKSANYATIEYCRGNLVQAQTIANQKEKQQIAQVLSSLGQTEDKL